MSGLPPDASAAAAVASLFFLATLAAPVNFRLTGKGFHLYIPLGISTAFRGVAHAAHASFFVSHNTALMAVYGALNAVGFGIAVAMCCCFIVIWLRNAAHFQPPGAARALSLAATLLVACVIAFGPILGVVAAAVVFGAGPSNPAVLVHGQHIRVASSSGFTAVSASALLISAYLAASWAAARRHARARTQQAQQQQQQQGGKQDPDQHHHQQQQEDGLIFVLAGCLLLLTWTAADRLSQYDHPAAASSAVLYYPLSVLPELLVAFVLAVPTLAARVALGGRYSAWLQQRGRVARGGGGSSDTLPDAQVGIEAGGVQMRGAKA